MAHVSLVYGDQAPTYIRRIKGDAIRFALGDLTQQQHQRGWLLPRLLACTRQQRVVAIASPAAIGW
jgi:hypothetical protein